MDEQPATLVRLTARAAVPADVAILDHRFQLVGGGQSPLELHLAPGVYLVQFKLGSSLSEQPVVLRPGSQPVEVVAPELPLSSPAPLGSTPTALHYKDFARLRSCSVDLTQGDGGQLFIFLRTATSDRDRQDIDSLFRVSVRDRDHRPVVDLHASAVRASDGLCGGYNLQLTPGQYFVRYDAGAVGPLEQTVVVCDGWQTQVFASSRVYKGTAGQSLGANLPNAAVFMAPIGEGFDPEKAAFVSAESARQALVDDRALVPEERVREVAREMKELRAVIPEEQLREMFRQKFSNPMLGLYAAHLMLLRPSRDWALLSEVVTNLRTVIGDHPDVDAVGLLSEVQSGSTRPAYTLPPMLKSSWRLLVAKSATDSGLIPENSYAAAIAESVWGTGAWLTWRPAVTRVASVGSVPAGAVNLAESIRAVQAYVSSNVRSRGAGAFIASVARDQTLTSTERTLLIYIVTAIHHGSKMRDFIQSEGGTIGWLSVLLKDQVARLPAWAASITGSGVLDPAVTQVFSPERLVHALNIPLSLISASLTTLAGKISQRS